MRHLAALLAALLLAVVGVACVPSSGGTQSGGCYGYTSAAGEDIDALIQHFWADAPADADWFTRVVAPRESGCDPCASYPSQHDCGRVFDINRNANGVLQNLGPYTSRALKAACPYILPERSWRYAACSLQVSRWKYEASGRAPWGG